MDPRSFDQLTRAIGASVSRRGVLKALSAAALGAIVSSARLGSARATSRKRSVGNSCRLNSDCASNICQTQGAARKICACGFPGDCPEPSQCHDATCTAGACGIVAKADGTVCGENERCCGGICTQLGSDVNCDSCGDACTPPKTCGGGGTPNVCGRPPCVPKTCAELQRRPACGSFDNGCGQTVDCGCPSGECCDTRTCIEDDTGGGGNCAGGCAGCTTSGAVLPRCQIIGCCEASIVPASQCSDALPCCNGGPVSSRSCIGGRCCLDSDSGYCGSGLDCCSGTCNLGTNRCA